MAVDRNYVLNKVMGRMMNPSEFDFDRLMGPPLYNLLSTGDLMSLNNVATSIRYSANTEKKLSAINEILTKRGFKKFTGGTNRVVYKFLEDESFLIKVATNNVALGDNPRELINQNIYKPFVTKVFEVSPCGTIGLFERGIPITSREEFLSVADDIFCLIKNWFTGQYVMDDIGSNYFLNWVLRPSFGPILCDFPYSYKLDGNKLYCNAPVVNDPTQKCGGVIDYDDGYNHLRCTKCGLIYRAKELEKAVNNNKVMVQGGNYDMVVKITSSKGVQRIENNPERYLDVSPKLVARGRKQKPSKISNEPTFKITGLRTPKPESQEEAKKENIVESGVETDKPVFIACDAIVSNTRDEFDTEYRTKCLILKEKDNETNLIIDGSAIIIDRIMNNKVKDLCIITSEAHDEMINIIDGNIKAIDELRRDNDRYTKIINTQEEELESLRSENEELEKKNAELIDYAKELSKPIDEANEYFEMKDKEIGNLKAQLYASETEINILNKTIDDLRDEILRYTLAVNDNQKLVDNNNVLSESKVTFNVISPLFTTEEHEVENTQESIEELKNDIEDKDIVEVIDKALPDGEDALITKKDDESEVKMYTMKKFSKAEYDNHYDPATKTFVLDSVQEASSEDVSEDTVINAYLEDLPVGASPVLPTESNNYSVVHDYDGDIIDTPEESTESSIIETSDVDEDHNGSTEEVIETKEDINNHVSGRMGQKIMIPEEVREQINEAAKVVSGNKDTKKNQPSNNKWDHKKNKKKHKKNGKQEGDYNAKG